MKSIPKGASTQVYAAICDNANNLSGKYLSDCNIDVESTFAKDDNLALKLWEYSVKVTNTKWIQSE